MFGHTHHQAVGGGVGAGEPQRRPHRHRAPHTRLDERRHVQRQLRLQRHLVHLTPPPPNQRAPEEVEGDPGR
eukprot:2179477-Pyramimonas_sp.AAC.1